MSRDKIIFEPNIPLILAFESPGVLKPSTRGPGQYQYFLTRSRIMWVDPEVHEQIKALDPNPGENFEVCQEVKRVGRQNVVSWRVGWPATTPG
jgi:hypothetical protein